MERRIILSALLIALALASVATAAVVVVPTASEQGRPSITLDQDDSPRPASELADVIEAVLPRVVNVQVTELAFGSMGSVEEGQGSGSGVVIDSSGIIVTNYHVVQDAFEVDVAFTDGETMRGSVIAVAPSRDLALIQVAAEKLPAIQFGKSSTLRLGDDVVAIGYPLGLGGPTVTRGIVSATDRDIRPVGGNPLTGLLQTDAAINPGNSGGAMVDVSGRLVGINTAAAQAGSAENVGFAIPADVAVKIIQEMLASPLEEQAWLGVALDTQAETAGALVTGIYPDSPAETAGIEAGNVILSLDGERISSARDLIDTVAERSPGTEVVLELETPQGMESRRVTLARRPGSFVQPDE
ncbi:MAG TPA: trypsin-like peptidase domain-containing protein [Actinomycetota bacterium]|nr:trypsin-like peptidase domain-containing protein [Actinomycetota bacterium]